MRPPSGSATEASLARSRETLERRDRLARRLDEAARKHPRLYRARVVAVALLGYAYVGGLLVVVLGAAVGAFLVHPLLFLKIGIGLIVLAVLVGRALWVRLEPPDGIRLERHRAPWLFSTVDDLRKELRAPRVHTIHIDGSLNASVYQRPRLGLLGWYRNHLILGLPLLDALAPDELRAVLAHELGHLSRSHGRLGAWIYRVRETWLRLASALEDRADGLGKYLVRPFFGWFGPYFAVSSLALMRAHEFEADRAAADAAGAETTARALVRFRVAGCFVGERFWPSVFAGARDRSTPPPGVYRDLASRVRDAADDEDSDRWLAEALRERSEPGDTHPSLSERIRELGVSARVPQGRVGRSASDEYLVGVADELAEQLGAEWREAVAPHWEEQRELERRDLEALEDLERRAPAGLTSEERREHAALVHRVHGDAEARPLYENLVEGDPDDAVASFELGRILLGSGDERGLEHLERACALDPAATAAACELAADFLARRDREHEAEGYRRRAREWWYLLAEAENERARLDPDSRLVEHGLPEDVLERLRATLAEHDIVEAYVARRELEHLSDEHPVYVVGVSRREKALRLRRGKPDEELVERLAAEIRLPGPFWVVSVREGNDALRLKFRRLDGARLIGRKPLWKPFSLRPVAVPLIGVLLVLTLVAVVLGADGRSESQVGIDQASERELGEAEARWATRANAACSELRRAQRRAMTRAAADRSGAARVAAVQRALQPFEIRLVRALGRIPYPTARAQDAFGLTAERLHKLNEALVARRTGRPRKARAHTEAWRSDTRADEAFRTLGAPACVAHPIP